MIGGGGGGGGESQESSKINKLILNGSVQYTYYKGYKQKMPGAVSCSGESYTAAGSLNSYAYGIKR